MYGWDLRMPKRVPFGISNVSDQIRSTSDKYSNLKSLDLMGYDWIAGMMENKAKEAQLDQSQEYFEELERFRRQNKQFCIATENRQFSNNACYLHENNYKKAFNDFEYHFQPDGDESLQNSEEKPPAVYAYTLNERLFPIPLDMDTAERGIPDPNSPHIIKISIPSNRFVHRNQKVQTMKERSGIHGAQVDTKSQGESLSLASHCQQTRSVPIPTMPSQKKGPGNNRSSCHQEPASLRGHILMDSVNSSDLAFESISGFGGNQPRSEQEAIDQLRRGKTGAKMSRMVPSALVNRSLNIESLGEEMNICQTRITLRDMDDCQPRSPIKTWCPTSANDSAHEPQDRQTSTGVPRPSLSRKQMSKVYGDALDSVRETAVSHH